MIFKGPFGFDPATFQGPFLTFLSFGSYLLPLAVLELFLRAQERGSASGRMAVAAGVLALTVAMGVGIFGATLMLWVPRIRAAYDGRTSIAATLSATIASRGVEAAVEQYRHLGAAERATYNFDERELNALGYTLLRAHQLRDAIRIFQLNVEAYPRSSNVYDSLAEAFADAGDEAKAVANYQEALRRDPNNTRAALSLQKLVAH